MTPISDLITYHREQAAEVDTEIGLLVERFNADYREAVSNDDLHKMIRAWRDHQRIARDTASYLETLQRRFDLGGKL